MFNLFSPNKHHENIKKKTIYQPKKSPKNSKNTKSTGKKEFS
jgi:hypothetical protein